MPDLKRMRNQLAHTICSSAHRTEARKPLSQTSRLSKLNHRRIAHRQVARLYGLTAGARYRKRKISAAHSRLDRLERAFAAVCRRKLDDLSIGQNFIGCGTKKVVTDNPFIEGEISTADGTLTNTLNADSGLSALASLGIQSMARRADFTLSETIADRTAIDQQLHAGVNLWADVSGERYEADGLAHGAEFKADMGYAAFGGDIALGQDYTVGAAFQYGKGTLRSAVSSIRNEIDSYGFALYGAKDFGAAKVVAEASYLWTENDITASQTALNQSVDANVWSVGIRGQHAFKAGAFTFTPSVGVRYSHLETDAMTIGAVNVEKQKQDLIQVPLALRVTAGETNAAGWQLAPFFKVAYVPTFGDKEIEVLSHETDVIDTNPVQSAFGLRAQNGNLLLNADFTVGGGKDGTSSVGGKIGVKYAF